MNGHNNIIYYLLAIDTDIYFRGFLYSLLLLRFGRFSFAYSADDTVYILKPNENHVVKVARKKTTKKKLNAKLMLNLMDSAVERSD